MSHPDWKEWRQATMKDFKTLIGKETWFLVPRPAWRKVIQSKWVFRTKQNADRLFSKLKARLVALGFSQVKGVNFTNLFSPESRRESLRLLLTVMGHRAVRDKVWMLKAPF